MFDIWAAGLTTRAVQRYLLPAFCVRSRNPVDNTAEAANTCIQGGTNRGLGEQG